MASLYHIERLDRRVLGAVRLIDGVTNRPIARPLTVAADGALSLTATTDRGVHCAVIFDPGNLTQAATFSLNIAHPR